MQRLSSGLSLLELIFTLGISSALLSFGTYAVLRFQEYWHGQQAIQSLSLLLHSGREQAILQKSVVTLCPLNPGKQCNMEWNNELTLFIDNNNNRQLDSGDLYLRTLAANINPHAMRSHTNNAISFDAKGFSAFATGSLSYCLKKQRTIAAVFIISRTGRIRRGTDSNQDGIPEAANGQNIPCPS